MNPLSLIQNMQVVDILRSGALIVAFLSVIVGNRKDRNAVNNWLFIDTVSSGFFGAGFFAVPDVILGYMVSSDLDPIHLLMARLFGVVLLASAYESSLARYSRNKSHRLISRALALMLLVVCMLVAQYRSCSAQKNAKFNDQHLTFGILGASLWFLGNLFYLLQANDLGVQESRSLSLRSFSNAYIFFDLLMVLLGVVIMAAFPILMYSDISVKGFKPDIVHMHMARTLGMMDFTAVVGYLLAFTSGSQNDLNNIVSSRMLVYGSYIPVLIAYQWWYQLVSPSLFLFEVIIMLVRFLFTLAVFFQGKKAKLV